MESIERLRFEAMVKKDFAYLDKVLSEDLIYTHSNGLTETKGEHIGNIQSGKLVYKSIQPEDITILIYKKSAVINGHIKVSVLLEGRDIDIRLRYLNMYVKRKGQWQLVAWQSSRAE